MRSSDELTADQARALLSLGLGERDEPQLTPGTIVADRFRIIALVGQGGMGDVYRADDMKIGQVVALKFLPLSASEFATSTFYGEVRVGRQVAHPNVARIY